MREFIDDEFSYELLAKWENGDVEAGKALAFITKYNNELYRGVLRKHDPDAIHKGTLYKDATDSHNARRRDLMSALRAGKLGPASYLVSIDETGSFESLINEGRDLAHEETMIEIVSAKTAQRVASLASRKKITA